MESFLIVEYIGIISASISGFLFAVRRACDLLGIFIAAFLTALGGGIMLYALYASFAGAWRGAAFSCVWTSQI